MGYKRIIVGTDGSPTATLAQGVAGRLAKRFKAELVIVCAYEPPRIAIPMAQAFLERARDDAERQRVRASVVLERGDPQDVILGLAEREGADLIVVGNKGMGQATRFKLGSVPDRVAHFAPCDLLIVNTTKPGRPGAGSSGTYQRIVVGTDGSSTASEAARKAFELAMLFEAEVTLVYAAGDPIVGAILLEQTAAARPDGVDVKPRVVEGEPAQTICAVAEMEGAGLIVVGNKGMAGARRFLGSVPNNVAHHAPTDVLIAKTVDRSISEIAPGHGAVIDVSGRRLAIYRDQAGQLSAISPRCTHMGCTVDWNDGASTWDCPCHGSRYDPYGEVIRGPADRPLAKLDLP